jgi:hypothetical protein
MTVPRGNVGDGEAVARLDVGALARDDDIAHLEAVRGQDVALLAILVLNQGDEGGTVGVVLEGEHGGGHVNLVTLKVDDTVLLLVAAALVAHGDSAIAVAARMLLELFQQALFRLDPAQTAIVGHRHLAARGRGRPEGFNGHVRFTPIIPQTALLLIKEDACMYRFAPVSARDARGLNSTGITSMGSKAHNAEGVS